MWSLWAHGRTHLQEGEVAGLQAKIRLLEEELVGLRATNDALQGYFASREGNGHAEVRLICRRPRPCINSTGLDCLRTMTRTT